MRAIVGLLLMGLIWPACGCESSGGGGDRQVGPVTYHDGDVVAKPDELTPAAPATIRPESIQTRPLNFEQVVHANDRVLFIGDDVTQQMYYTRATAAALMGLRPRDNLRFFNGGKEGATAASAKEWVDDLLGLSQPTVVFICFGLNDGEFGPPTDQVVQKYESSLNELVMQVKGHPGIRQVVVMSAPAVQTGGVQDQNKGGYNKTLRELALASQRAAKAQGAAFVDLYEPMRVVYAEAAKAGGDMLTIGGRLPTEDAHTVIASVILWGVGVTSEQLGPIGWAPLKPRHMGRVRGALGLELKTPSFTAARNSRLLYEKLREFDQVFFQAWRLGGRAPQRWDRRELMKKGNEVWLEIDNVARAAYAGLSSAGAER